MSVAIIEVIEELDLCLQSRFPAYYAKMQPGLTELELAHFEAELGIRLPEDYKALYRWKNGCTSGNLPYWNGWFLGKDGVAQFAKEQLELRKDNAFTEDFPQPFDILDNWWNPQWIPLLNLGNGDLVCLDMAGSFGGIPGQILKFIHDDYYRRIKYQSLYQWLLTTATVLEAVVHDEADRYDEVFGEHASAIERLLNPGYPIGFP